MPILLFLGTTLVIELIRLMVLGNNCIMDHLEEEVSIHENSPEFFSCLDGISQKRWFTQETYFRKILNVKMMEDDQYEKLRTAKRK